MAALTEWVRRLVLLVIVASFLELLAPNNSLKRYVRLVVGFLVLTAVLTPLVALVRGEDLARRLALAAGGGGLADPASASGGAGRAAERLAEANRRLEESLLAGRLSAYLEQELAGPAGGPVKVVVRVGPGGTVQRVTITAPPGRGAALRSKAAALAGVAGGKISVVEEAGP